MHYYIFAEKQKLQAGYIRTMIMEICETCGNEIPGNPVECPYCGSPVYGLRPSASTPKPKKATAGTVLTVNLEAGKPDVAQALAHLDIKIAEFRQQGVALIKVIHGWGSSGSGGRIKAALPAHLAHLRRRRIIRGFVAGDQFAVSTRQGARLISKFPALKESISSTRKNPGITFIEL